MNVLFLCTHNSARSIMAEALLNHLGRGEFHGFSAGSHPGGAPNPLALESLERQGIPTEGLYSKSWDTFGGSAEPMDLIVTVCDDAAGEVCPVWPGAPISAHWGVPDPSNVEGPAEEQLRAFARTLITLRHRIELLLALPRERLDALAMRERIQSIGKA